MNQVSAGINCNVRYTRVLHTQIHTHSHTHKYSAKVRKSTHSNVNGSGRQEVSYVILFFFSSLQCLMHPLIFGKHYTFIRKAISIVKMLCFRRFIYIGKHHKLLKIKVAQQHV